jgi:hypothetical protein
MDNTELILTILAGIGFALSAIGAFLSYRHLVLMSKAELKLIDKLKGNTDVANKIQALTRQAYSDNIAQECAIISTLNSVLSTLPDEDRRHIIGLRQPSIIGRINYANKLIKQSRVMYSTATNLSSEQGILDKVFGWFPLEEILGNHTEAYRSGTTSIERAKKINLGVDQRMVLVMELNEIENQHVNVIMSVYHADEHSVLPENLKFMLIREEREFLENKISTKISIKQSFTGKRGEQFSVNITLDNVNFTEYFII